jgi:2-succinyl-6-hydroxy-2,4-cyclohexadiene-1-carboxylate synthase
MGEVREDVVLLHGFAGSRRTWDAVLEELAGDRLRPRALDLPGHGENVNAPRPISFAGCVTHVLTSSPERFALCGYSLGGRVALHVALAAPMRVTRLVLVSSTAGIADRSARAERRAADHRLAGELERGSLEDFIDRWSAQSMFVDDPPDVRELARADYSHSRPDALGAVLRGVGTGEMEPLWERLHELELPVTVVMGERDEKFQAIGARMVELLPHSQLAVLPGGHRLPLECPATLAATLAG